MDNLVIKNEYIKMQDNTISIDGIIGRDMFNDKYSFANFKRDLKNVKGKIILEINSMGGDLNIALSIYDLIRSMDNKVITKITSTTASSGTIIALAGDSRYIAKNSRYLIHKPAIRPDEYINSTDIEGILNHMKELDKTLIDLYVSRSNLTYEQVLDLMNQETFIDAESAVKYGFCDDIIKDKNDYEKNIYTDMDNKLLELLNAKDDVELYSSVVNLLDENDKLKKDFISLSKGGASQIINQDETITGQTEIVENQDETITGQTEMVENQDETITGQTEMVKEDDEKVENQDEDGNDVDEKEKLLKRIAELEKALEKLQKEKEEQTEIEITNFLKDQLGLGVINKSTYDSWFSIGNEKGLDFVKNMITGLPVKREKLSNIINDYSSYSQKELYDMWKSGKIDGNTYSNLKKK